jgi:hypothetical protein
MPTFSGPRTWQRERNFSLARALIGTVYYERRPWQRDLNWRARATSDFPEMAGVLRMASS